MPKKKKIKRTPSNIIRALLAGIGIILFWRGIWLVADETPILSEPIISIIVGILILYFTRRIVGEFLG